MKNFSFLALLLFFFQANSQEINEKTVKLNEKTVQINEKQ